MQPWFGALEEVSGAASGILNEVHQLWIRLRDIDCTECSWEHFFGEEFPANSYGIFWDSECKLCLFALTDNCDKFLHLHMAA